MKNIFFFFLLIALGFGAYFFAEAFKENKDETIRISINPWVGFSPFAYAQEKGWLESTPFRLVWVVDLSDNSRLYEKGFTQGMTATQFELLHFKNPNDFATAFLIDRSNGADAIVSNYTVEELRKINGPIQLFLEQGSLNEDMFKAFIAENHLQNLDFKPVNIAQDKMTRVESEKGPVVLITYEPYLSGLIAKGFKEISSTKELKTFHVIDALFVQRRYLKDNEAEFAELHAIFQKALEKYHADPKEFYETVKGYLNGQTYEEFIRSAEKIDWITIRNHDAMIQKLQEQHIDTGSLVR